MEDEELGLHVDWVALPFVLIPAALVSLYARSVSGGWTQPWLSLKPVWWFGLLFLVPPLGFVLLAVNLFVYRKVPGAITGRTRSS
ncbi:hypothetical protein ACK8HX_00015 [Oryzobacter sp. R7]|uniref:hypothetical protein n=1 Tax=Oryzobacter faecalis TaxID=3388656 RepID=UPI00398D0628